MGMWRDKDIDEFTKQNFIPICPSYEIHNLLRMGCRNCVGYKSWMIAQSTDPTGLRTHDLKKNLADMERFDINEKGRFKKELEYTVKKLKKLKPIVDRDALQIISDYAMKHNVIKKSLMKCKIPVFQKGITNQ